MYALRISSLAASSSARPDGLDAADLQQIGAVNHLQHLPHVLLDDQHRVALAADAADQLEDLRDDHGRQAHRGLIQQDQFRLAHQCAGDRAHLLLTARQGAGELCAALLEAREQREYVLQPLIELRARSRDECAHAQVVLDVQAREKPAALRHVCDAGFDDLVG